jgi:hypothetical protein
MDTTAAQMRALITGLIVAIVAAISEWLYLLPDDRRSALRQALDRADIQARFMTENQPGTLESLGQGVVPKNPPGSGATSSSSIGTVTLPDILSGRYFDILSDILSGILSGIYSGALSGISSEILSGILSGISSEILCG